MIDQTHVFIISISGCDNFTACPFLAGMDHCGTLAGEQGQFQEDSRLSVGLDRTYAPQRRLRLELVAQREDVAFGKGSVDELYLRVRWFYGH